MKRIIITMLLFISALGVAQEEKGIKAINEVNLHITSLSYSMESVEELQSIDWKELETLFEENDNDQEIALKFELKLGGDQKRFKSSFSVKGKTKNMDDLINKAKKGVKSLIKISKNYNKQ